MEDAVDGGGGGSPLPAESGERTDDKPHVPSRPVPARPAPPPPGVARQSPIIPRSQPSTAVRTEQMSAPAKPSEPPAKPSGTPAKPSGTPAKPSGTPAKPSGTPAKPSGPPAKPSGTPAQVTTKKQDLFEQSSHKSAGKTKSQSSVKKRLEITIVDARPMSQVGFRSVEPQPTLTAGKPAIPVTQANHHSVKPALADSQAESSQPTIMRPSRPKSIVGITEAAGDNSESQLPPPLPKRSPIVSVLITQLICTNPSLHQSQLVLQIPSVSHKKKSLLKGWHRWISQCIPSNLPEFLSYALHPDKSSHLQK
ncbi:vegetative cell wall protein gp1-like isoform X3 [Pomacea canaliculata]|uniref:vegetative cell wall protein gp1-like isoform X3 n=1 Tax=Pomacea canaliculata TaxID=400727 RepID=UPI000D72AC12|nr:vegetative cell wall protein gp1-like isoform X3 [Pomacea canaliculata]